MAFTVDAVTTLEGFSSSSLPKVDITIRDAETVCEGDLILFTDAPEPISSSEPFDVAPPASSTATASSLHAACIGNGAHITKANYASEEGRLVVWVEHPGAPSAALSLLLDGFVSDPPMVYDASEGRYEFDALVGGDVHSVQVVVGDGAGVCAVRVH